MSEWHCVNREVDVNDVVSFVAQKTGDEEQINNLVDVLSSPGSKLCVWNDQIGALVFSKPSLQEINMLLVLNGKNMVFVLKRLCKLGTIPKDQPFLINAIVRELIRSINLPPLDKAEALKTSRAFASSAAVHLCVMASKALGGSLESWLARPYDEVMEMAGVVELGLRIDAITNTGQPYEFHPEWETYDPEASVDPRVEDSVKTAAGIRADLARMFQGSETTVLANIEHLEGSYSTLGPSLMYYRRDVRGMPEVGRRLKEMLLEAIGDNLYEMCKVYGCPPIRIYERYGFDEPAEVKKLMYDSQTKFRDEMQRLGTRLGMVPRKGRGPNKDPGKPVFGHVIGQKLNKGEDL